MGSRFANADVSVRMLTLRKSSSNKATGFYMMLLNFLLVMRLG